MDLKAEIGKKRHAIWLVDVATAETNTSEDWDRIIRICELADGHEAVARETVSYLAKRVVHKNVNVGRNPSIPLIFIIGRFIYIDSGQLFGIELRSWRQERDIFKRILGCSSEIGSIQVYS